MPFCIKCGTNIDDDDRFCPECGFEMNIKAEEPVVEETVDATPIVEEAKKEERKIVYGGEVRKCPNCGEILKSFSAYCPACGCELRGSTTISPISELVNKLENTDSLDERIELITNFYVPNTKEDIIDFFILAISNLENSKHDTDDAWKSKLDQTYHKAKLSFGGTPEFEYLESLYYKAEKTVSKRAVFSIIRNNKSTSLTVLLVVVGILSIITGIVLLSINKSGEQFDFSFGGLLAILLGINFLLAPTWVIEEIKKNEVKNYTKSDNDTVLTTKKYSDYIIKNCDDVVVLLRKEGFVNIECKPVKKSILDKEGAVKEISIDGITDFKRGDQFNKGAKVIVRYYSKYC